jgi:hypothetical protein
MVLKEGSGRAGLLRRVLSSPLKVLERDIETRRSLGDQLVQAKKSYGSFRTTRQDCAWTRVGIVGWRVYRSMRGGDLLRDEVSCFVPSVNEPLYRGYLLNDTRIRRCCR